MSTTGSGLPDARSGALPPSLTVLMPCLNEAETLVTCIRKATGFLDRTGLAGEVLIADNGSTDGSPELALAAGARVIQVSVRGYGAALRAGIEAARCDWVIMGDADGSYDFSRLESFVSALRGGADLVVGNRFAGGIDRGAMPLLHRYLGNPVLSWVGRALYHSKVRDFHCGLRGGQRQALVSLGLQSLGMEYASEMILRAEQASLRVAQVPTSLAKDGRSRPPHLNPWRDGARHLRLLLLFGDNATYALPAALIGGIGVGLEAVLSRGPLVVGGVRLSVGTLIAAMGLCLVACQVLLLGGFSRLYASEQGYRPRARIWRRSPGLSVTQGLLLAAAMVALGLAAFAALAVLWGETGFSRLSAVQVMGGMVPAVTAMLVGMEGLMTGALFVLLEPGDRSPPVTWSDPGVGGPGDASPRSSASAVGTRADGGSPLS